MGPAPASRNRRRRRGSAYIIILGSAMIVTVIGLSAIVATRIQIRNANWISDIVKARTCSQTGVQWALLKISTDPDWRTHYPNGQWVTGRGIDDGTFRVWVTDASDGDLTDSQYDGVTVKVAGYTGDARQLIQLELAADLRPLEALSTCLHAASDIEIKDSGSVLTFAGAPLSTNADFDNDGTVVGDLEALTVSKMGTVTGTRTVPAPEKHAPDPGTFDTYKGLATAIPFTGDIQDKLITSATNPYGAVNPDGLYYIDTDGHDIKIERSRIHGTLVISCPGKKLTVEKKVLLHNARADYPVLIVDGNVEIKLKSGTEDLSEAESGNMNPPGSPYEGASDIDQTDVYTAQIVGLVHVTGNLAFKETTRLTGLVICGGDVVFEGNADGTRITHDPAYAQTPPTGYTYVERMKITPGSWKRAMP